jgi:VWFA-related protein
MRVKAILIALGLGLVAHRVGLAQGQPSGLPDQVFRVTSELVVLDAQVLNRKTGLPVASLKPQDFEVFEDGVKQEIISLSQDKLPLSIVFLFDLTDSVQPVLVPLAQGAAEALGHLKPEDEIAVMVYQAKAQLLQDFTTNRDLAVAAIERASTGRRDESEEAYFNEGVFQAAVQSRKATNPSSRRVIVWLTDNVPNVPSHEWVHTEQQALREVFESGAVVCSLLEMSAMSRAFTVLHKHNPMFTSSRKHFPPGDVNHYADQTGGLVLKSSKSEVATKLAELIDRVRSRYSLAYKPSAEQPAGRFCRIEVKLSRPAADREGQVLVRARRGYYR